MCGTGRGAVSLSAAGNPNVPYLGLVHARVGQKLLKCVTFLRGNSSVPLRRELDGVVHVDDVMSTLSDLS